MLVFADLNKGVNSHNSHVWLRLGIIHEIKVDQLLKFKVVSLHAVDNIREESRHILACGNNLLKLALSS